MSGYRWLLLAGTLLVPRLARAEPPGIQLYEEGEYEAAVLSFESALSRLHSSEERGLMLTYLAAALHALGRVEEARKHLEVLAREHPEARVDPARFLPELVALAEDFRQQVRAEQEAAARARPPPPPTHWRPEAFVLFEAVDTAWTVGAGLGCQRTWLEGTARVVLGEAMALQVQGGALLHEGAWRPLVGLRASFLPGLASASVGPVVGLRYSLPARLVALVDVGGEYFVIGRDDRYRFALTAQAGLGFDVSVP